LMKIAESTMSAELEVELESITQEDAELNKKINTVKDRLEKGMNG